MNFCCAGEKAPSSLIERQKLARLSRAPSRPPSTIAFGENNGVHRAGAGAGDRLDVEPLILEDRVEHAPGEGAMRSRRPAARG